MLALQICGATAAQQEQIEGARFVGSAGCKSSSCHGGAGEKRSHYITWARHDIHTRGYAILTDARSERMADALNLPQVREGMGRATTSARCTICHSPFQTIPQAQRASTVDPMESVSCENCHGAAGTWLRGHTRNDWTYATRVGAGMRDLKNVYVRANTCVGCHQTLDSDIADAGHPELVFELDSQSVAEPKHWRDPADSSVRAWLVGQAVALREVSWRLAAGSDIHTHSQFDALSWLLGEVTQAEATLPPLQQPSFELDAIGFKNVQQQADALARRAATQEFNGDFARRLLNRLAACDPTASHDMPGDSPDRSFYRAQRLVLALDRLSAAGAARVTPELRALRDELRDPSAFDTTRFVEQLARFRQSLEQH